MRKRERETVKRLPLQGGNKERVTGATWDIDLSEPREQTYGLLV